MLRNKLIIIPWILTATAALLSAVTAIIKFGANRSQFVINYSFTLKPFLGDVNSLYSIIGILLGILAINFTLAFYIFQRQKFLSYLISAASLAVSLIFLVTILTVTSIN